MAESSAGVLSANIINDTTALVSSSHCSLAFRHYMYNSRVYVKQWYGAKTGADGCNFFINQSIAHTEENEARCPFAEDICALGHRSAFTLDTGITDIRAIGINSPLRYQFRRRTTCAPLKADSKILSLEKVGDWYDLVVAGNAVVSGAQKTTMPMTPVSTYH